MVAYQVEYWCSNPRCHWERCNNNIFPLAFAIVGQEDIANWCWFLHQLKICLGGEVGKFGPYTIMSDRQKVCISLFIFMHISYVVDSSFCTPVA